MLNFHDFNIHTLSQFFHTYPYSASIFTYCISFIEAMAVVGMFVPGVIAMPAIGFLIGSAIIPAGSIFMWATLGAITGDCLSYLLGIYFQTKIPQMWPFTRWPKLLQQSEKFFHAHGGKSVFIGRFIGPMRAMLPMIAGMLKMSVPRFLLAAIPSAALWSIAYMLPGILLGALSLELPKKVALEFALGALGAIGLSWLIGWLIHHYFKKMRQLLDSCIRRVWHYCHRKQHSKLFLITKFLSDPKEQDNHQQLTLVIMAAIILVLFLWVMYQAFSFGILVDFSYALYHLLSSFRVQILEKIFVFITFLGDILFILIATGIITLWLGGKRQWHIAWHWLGAVFLSGVLITSVKLLLYSPRPGDILYGMHESSFPSAHAGMSLAFYGFLAVVIARELKAVQKSIPYMLAGILVTLIAFSRIYLGAHWLIDILGGVLLGLMAVVLATISYRRHHILRFPVRRFIVAVISVLTISWFGYSMVEFKKQAAKYVLLWPQQIVAVDDLVKDKRAGQMPLYRLNRLGRPIEAFNIIYVGNLAKLQQVLLHQGWTVQPITLGLQQILQSFSPTSTLSNLSILPQLYRNQKVALLLTKKTKEDEMIILRLWPSEVTLKDSQDSLWVGAVKCQHHTAGGFSLKYFKENHTFMGATEFLAKHLNTKNFYWWHKHYTSKQQPLEMAELHWDGKQLVIQAKAED